MKKEVEKEILFDLTETIKVMQVKESKDFEKLKKLSDHAIEDVALHKDLDVIAMTVLLYSLFKVAKKLTPEDYKDILKDLKIAQTSLEQHNFGKYNRTIKNLFKIVKKSNAKVKEHLEDVMKAARIKKGSVLLQKGLSIGQAAGLMGLSNWELQGYAGKTNIFDQKHEAIPAKKRMMRALRIFNLT
jgi:hypothetical protein